MPRDQVIAIPSPSLVVMVGASGSGKSSFCSRHFLPTQIVSSDACRALLTDDAADQQATRQAFALAHAIIDERLSRRRLTILDATNLDPAGRRAALGLAARHHLPAVALVLDLPLRDCLRHDAARPDRRVGRAVIARHAEALRAALPDLAREGFARVHHVRDAGRARALRVAPTPLSCDRSGEHGPFDLIGDLHGCARELAALLRRLGYRKRGRGSAFRHAEGRKAVFIGDLVDRGPRVVEAASLVMDMVEEGEALSVPGNHDEDLARTLEGGGPKPGPGTLLSLKQLAAVPKAARNVFHRRFIRFVDSLPSHLLLDDERLAVAHAGIKREYLGRDSETVRRFALRGEATGTVDRHGLPVRVNWALGYAGRPFVVYGHTPVRTPETIRRTCNIDTGCVYGGSLTAMRYPEMETVSVSAARVYYRSPRLARAGIGGGVGLRADTRIPPAP